MVFFFISFPPLIKESVVTPNAESSKKLKTDSDSEPEIFILQVSKENCSLLTSTLLFIILISYQWGKDLVFC